MEFVSCTKHPEQKISLIHIGKNQTQLLCEFCLDEDFAQEINPLTKFPISINKILQQPEHILKNFNLGQEMTEFLLGTKNKDDINDKIIDLEKQTNQIVQLIQKWLEEFKAHVRSLIDFRVKLRNESLQIINLEELKQLLLSLKQEEKIINPDAFQQIQEKLNNYFKSILCDESKQLKQKISTFLDLGKKKTQIPSYVRDQLRSIIQNLNQMKQFKNDIVSSIFPCYSVNQNIQVPNNIVNQNLYLIQSNIIKEKFLNKLTQIIQDRTKKQIVDSKLIYLGSKDGLNGQKFRDKVNGKSNLLLIFQSKSKYVFGSFSPIQWNNKAEWVKDETNQSFIFSETHDEIYPIIESQNQYAFHCSDGAGPWIGYNGNIGIHNDFQSGTCSLGTTYKWDKYNNGITDHLYGSATPNIIESEIFEIFFK